MQFTLNKNIKLRLLPTTLSSFWPDSLGAKELAEMAIIRRLVVDMFRCNTWVEGNNTKNATTIVVVVFCFNLPISFIYFKKGGYIRR